GRRSAERRVARSRPTTQAAGSPVHLAAETDDRRVVRYAGAIALHARPVQRELEVVAVVPVHAHGEGVHLPALDPGIVEVQGVGTRGQLPRTARPGGRGGARHATAIRPALPGEVVHRTQVSAAGGEVPAGEAVHVTPHVFRLQLERACHPQTFDTGGRQAVGV